jgi:diacylglycerol kinase (ATP)
MAKDAKPPRKTGVAHFFAAAGYSIAGFRRLMRESAGRQEVGLILALVMAFVVLGASLVAILGLLALGLLLLAVEALNTAIEELVDHLSPGWSEWAKNAKDLGSLAVACVIGGVLLYAGIILCPAYLGPLP